MYWNAGMMEEKMQTTRANDINFRGWQASPQLRQGFPLWREI